MLLKNTSVAKHLFQVVDKENITPHYIRIRLKSSENIKFGACTLGANNKIFLLDEDQNEVMRTYTHRGYDPSEQIITIDFVDHGDEGLASSWARKAKEGDPLKVAMKIKETQHYPSADWYLFGGDATAIPVICCLLESLPTTAKGVCLMEVGSEEDIHPELQHEGFEVKWITQNTSSWLEAIKNVVIPQESTHFAYIATEYSHVKSARKYFKEDLGWNSNDFYAYSYWKAGEKENLSAQARRIEKES